MVREDLKNHYNIKPMYNSNLFYRIYPHNRTSLYSTRWNCPIPNGASISRQKFEEILTRSQLSHYRRIVNPTEYRAFHGFGQARFADGGSILGSSQLSLLFELPLKTTLNLKVVKIDSKIIILHL